MAGRAFYGFKKTRQPDGSGANVYSFIPKWMLPLFSLPGPGTPYSMQWMVTQPEQLYYNQSQIMTGQLGVVAGQVALQPLIDNRGVSG